MVKGKDYSDPNDGPRPKAGLGAWKGFWPKLTKEERTMAQEKDVAIAETQDQQGSPPQAAGELCDAEVELQFEAYRHLIHQLRLRASLTAPTPKN